MTRPKDWYRQQKQLWKLHQESLKALKGKSIAPKRVPPNPEHHQTAADRLDWLVQKYNATYKIHRFRDGMVVIAFKMEDEITTVSSGLASSTAKAVSQLVEKLNEK